LDAGSQLVVDFDYGTGAHDALERLINCTGLGLGKAKVCFSPATDIFQGGSSDTVVETNYIGLESFAAGSGGGLINIG